MSSVWTGSTCCCALVVCWFYSRHCIVFCFSLIPNFGHFLSSSVTCVSFAFWLFFVFFFHLEIWNHPSKHRALLIILQTIWSFNAQTWKSRTFFCKRVTWIIVSDCQHKESRIASITSPFSWSHDTFTFAGSVIFNRRVCSCSLSFMTVNDPSLCFRNSLTASLCTLGN